MGDVASLSVGRDDDQRDAGAVAEEVERLNVSGVVVAAAFIEGDEDCGVPPQFGLALHGIDDFLGEAFEEVELGGGG